MDEIRLQKFLANNGVDSRRKCEEHILNGKVTVNGKVTQELGFKVNPNKDKVCFDGKLIRVEKTKLAYILINKPEGYVTTLNDEFDRPKVIDLLKGVKERILPVGRLDMYTSGALILTNDGDFIYKVTHPKHEVEKTYIAKIKGIIPEKELEKLRLGVEIEDYVTAPAKVSLTEKNKDKNTCSIKLIIHEGKNRQIRKMFECIGFDIKKLHREKIGQISTEGLKLGQWRYLEKYEVASLLKR